MPSRKTIAWFAVKVAFLYCAATAPWPGLQQAYSQEYRCAAQTLLGSFGRDGSVEFVPAADPRGSTDTQIIIRNRRHNAFASSPHAPWRAGYLPAAMLAALAIATPLPWSRRLKTLALGLAAVHLYVAMRLAITVAYGFNGTGEWCLYELPQWWSSALSAAYEMLCISPSTPYLVAVLAWGLVAFRRGDWGRIFERERPLPDRRAA